MLLRMMGQLSRSLKPAAILLAIAMCAASHPSAANPLTDLLRRASEYVRQFEHEFAAVITDETYDQKDSVYVRDAPTQDHRHIRSEMLFMRLPGQGLSWLTARNVLEVDGSPVADSADRLERAIKGDRAGLLNRLRSVADEGARFNLGRIQRNFNDPILALLFLDRAYQPRFKFRLAPDRDMGSDGEVEEVSGVRARKVLFKETGRPSLIKEVGGRNLFTSGSLWINAADGVVVRTEVTAVSDLTGTSLMIRVDYRREPKLDMWIPARMVEHYRYPDMAEEVDCIATYSNPRRFETSGRVILR
jgi:hypothetical protein